MKATLHNRTDLPVEETVSWALEMTRADNEKLRIRISRTDSPEHHGWNRLWSDGWLSVSAYLPRLYPYTAEPRLRRNAPPAVDPQCWQEALVCILGHEFSHLAQIRRGVRTKGYTRRPPQPHWRRTPKGKVWIEPKQEQIEVRGQVYDEVEAEWAEYVLLYLYRKEHS